MTGRRDPERDFEDLLQDGGGELGNLYRRLPRYEPPRRLDRAILGEAARAVHSGRAPRRQRWIIGVGSAAGLVLAAGIAWRIGHDPMNQPAASPGETAPRSAPSVVPVQPISDSVRSRHDEPAPAPSPVDSAVPSAPSPARATGGAAQSVPTEGDKSRLKKSLNAAPKPSPPRPQAAPAPMQKSVRPKAPPEPFPADAKKEQAEVATTEAAAANRESPSRGAGLLRQRAQPPAGAMRLPESAPTTSVELRRDLELAPEAWLAHIHQLMRQGRRQQAAESLRLFQRAHPDWEIPDDLRALQR